LLHLGDRLVGLSGLRAVHVAWVALIFLLAYSLFWREVRSHLTACLATSIFATVSWYRLFQFRPELVSVLLAFVLYRLLFDLAGAPGWILAFRSLRTAVYMRNVPRNRANRERIERYYEREAVPFDL
jgi:hypothetical protein